MNRNLQIRKFFTIVAGLSVAALAGYFIFDAVHTGIVSGRGHTYSLEDSPKAFFAWLGLYIACLVAGILLTLSGFRDDDF